MVSDIFFDPLSTPYIVNSVSSVLERPRPVVAFPCGSKSITKTFLFI